MSRPEIVTVQTVIELLIWIAVFTAIHVQRKRHTSRPDAVSLAHGEASFPYGSFALFAALQAGDNLAYLVIHLFAARSFLSPWLVDFSYNCVYWAAYLLQTVLVFFLIATLIRSSLRPLPGLLAAASTIFRWASILAFALAVTAHLPTLRLMNWHHNLTGLCLSFQFCVCTFEITFIWLLLKYMRKLGLFVRSREVGFALGLAAFGLSAYVAGFVNLVVPSKMGTVNMFTELVEILTAAIWLYYVVMPEPKRQPHSLSPASSLMKWNEVALKLGMGGRQAEQLPFISGVESKVDAVLDRFKVRS